MFGLHDAVQANAAIAWAVLIVAFAVLAKCADIFVEGSVAMAEKLGVPTLVIGIFLVSLATTAPELSVSLASALRGNPEMALGNAIGSVIVDDGLALAVAGLLALAPVMIIPHVFRTAAVFLIGVQVLTFLFVARDVTLARWEGVLLVLLFFCYSGFLYIQHKTGRLQGDVDLEAIESEKRMPWSKVVPFFVLGIAGVIVAADFIVVSATSIAVSLGISKAVIALTLVAFGTSIPEVATCITAARKGKGALAVGNILGADIMNICWIAGASAIVNDLVLPRRDIYLMFPWMFAIVAAMLLMLSRGYRLTRKKGLALLLLYLMYIASFFLFYPPQKAVDRTAGAQCPAGTLGPCIASHIART
jgi:cation:H+ antiporter